MAPPASLRTTIRRWGSSSPAPSSSPPASCRNVTSPSSTVVSWRPPSAMPVAVEMVPSIPERPRLAKTMAPGSAGGRAGEVHVADAVGGAEYQLAAGVLPDQGADGRAGGGWRTRRGSGRRRAARRRLPAARHRATRGAAAGELGQVVQDSSGSSVRRPGSYQATGTGWYRAEGTSARASRALTGRERVGRPKSTTRSIGCAESGPKVSSSSRYGPTAFGPNRALEDGSASSGRPWARAKASATGPASCPASTTVRRSGRPVEAGGKSRASGPRGGAVDPAAGLGRQPVAGRGNERVAEGKVELDGPGRGVLEGPGGGAEGGLDGAPRVAAGGHVDGETDMLAEEVQLHGGLVGAGPAELLGTVGRDHHERDGCVVGLHHGRQEIADGGPGRGEHGRRAHRWPGPGPGP